MVTVDAIERRMPLRVTFHAKAHVYSVNWHYSVHRLHRPVASLTGQPRRNMRAMGEFHEIRQLVDAIPLNLERRLLMVSPWPRHRLDTAEGSAPVASHASLHRRDARVLGTARVLVAVLAWDLVHPRVDAVAERNRLYYIGSWQPRAFRKKDNGNAKRQEHTR
jgi:hypothetical protein